MLGYARIIVQKCLVVRYNSAQLIQAQLIKLAQSRFLIELSYKMLKAEAYMTEGVLTLCSIWACYVLLTPPSNFNAFPAAYSLVHFLQGDEALWGIFAGFAAVLKIIGLMLMNPHRGDTSIYCRSIGLGMSGFFWAMMGISAIVGNPDTLFGVTGLAMALRAWWTLIRGPTVPGTV